MIPTHLQDLVDDFAFLEDWEDRYMHVIELGKNLPALSAQDRTEANKVKGCASQVWLVTSQDGPKLHYQGDSDAHIVKGLVAITLQIFSGQDAKTIIKTDVKEIFETLGLAEHLSAQRANGLASMVESIKQDAATLC